MADTSWIGPAISATASTVNQILGTAAQAGASKDAIRYQNSLNRDNAIWANDIAIQNWQRENEYNTPANQMKRLQEAGLNPNLIYGNGSASTGNASPLGAPKHASADSPDVPDFGDFGASAAISAFTQIRNLSRQDELAKVQMDMQKAQTAFYNSQKENVDAKTLNELFKYNFDKDTRDYEFLKKIKEYQLMQSTIDEKSQGIKESEARIGQIEANTRQIYANIEAIRYKTEHLMPAQVASIAQSMQESAARILNLNADLRLKNQEYDFNDAAAYAKLETLNAALADCIQRTENGKLEFQYKKFQMEVEKDTGIKLGANPLTYITGFLARLISPEREDGFTQY